MNEISYSRRRQTYTNALIHFGTSAQMIVALEEFSEVSKELCKILRGSGDMEHLAEEIADAIIMLEQLRYFFGLDEKVCKYMDQKIERLDDALSKRGTYGNEETAIDPENS